jgi:DNA-binding GntR family transcriptional regulator
MATTDRASRAYDALRDLIVRGQLAPGARLVETEIAKRLRVSRTPVREALRRLEHEGYIASDGGKQVRPSVAPLTKADVQELLAIVGELEAIAVRGAAELPLAPRRTLVRALRTLNANLRKAAGARALDLDKLYRADEEFHRRYVTAGAGPRLRALHEAVKPQAERYIRMYVSLLAGSTSASAGEHDAIIAAIGSGDPVASERAVRTNWKHAATRLARAIGSMGERGNW